MATSTIGLAALLLVPLLLAARVTIRLLRTAGGARIRRRDVAPSARVSIIVPVLNEQRRLAACLDGLVAQPAEVVEILVVDGGSTDGTQELVGRYAQRDPRVRLIDASPVPADATGKAWGLHCGLRASAAATDAILCVDADVRVAPLLTRSLLAHLEATSVAALSVATGQRLSGRLEGLLHPSMLATLVYRFGIPGGATMRPSQVQANGQCFLARREMLIASGAFVAAQASLCEDVTAARCLAAAGHAVGFYEADDLVEATMYADWREAWRNWPRSLTLRDQYFGWRGALGIAEVVLVQALAAPALAIALVGGAPRAVTSALAVVVALRLGVLAGMARAYVARPWTYWLSPLADLPVAIALVCSALRRRHTWRGRTYERTGPGRFRRADELAPPGLLPARVARPTGTRARPTSTAGVAGNIRRETI